MNILFAEWYERFESEEHYPLSMRAIVIHFQQLLSRNFGLPNVGMVQLVQFNGNFLQHSEEPYNKKLNIPEHQVHTTDKTRAFHEICLKGFSGALGR